MRIQLRSLAATVLITATALFQSAQITFADSLSRSDVLELQFRLNQLGHNAGKPDGLVGPRTRAAAQAFARANNVPAEISARLLRAARQEADDIEGLVKPNGDIDFIVHTDQGTALIFTVEAVGRIHKTEGRQVVRDRDVDGSPIYTSIFDASGVEATSELPLQAGVAFGYLVRVPTPPRGERLRIDHVVTWPDRIDGATQHFSERYEHIYRKRPGNPRYWYRHFDEQPPASQAGAWTFRLENNGRTLISRTFRLTASAGDVAQPPEAAEHQSTPQASPVPAAPEPLSTFRDCPHCPEMVVIPPGQFMMGASNKDEAIPFVEWNIPNEKPRHRVTITEPFAIGKYEVTVEEFDRYVQETGAEVGGLCGVRLVESGPHARKFTGSKHPQSDAQSQSPNMVYIIDGSYAQPGLPVSPRQPAVCVSRNEIEGYLGWLSGKTGRTYRLPSEAEWEYAARAGTQTVAFWGDDLSKACDYANFGDKASGYQAGFMAPCSEDIRPLWTAEVGSYKPNNWGLHDMAGNVQEAVQDCWHGNYEGAPTDGSPWEEEDCLLFVARGGDYELPYVSMRAAERLFFGYVEQVSKIQGKADSHNSRGNVMGFRVAAAIEGTSAGQASSTTDPSPAQPSRVGPPPVTWTATSGTAIAITGNLTVSGDELIFGDGTRLALNFVAEEQSVWASGGATTGKIFRLDPPRDPVLLNGATLCGMPDPVTYLVLSEPSPDSLALTVFTSPSPPSGLGDRSCATYFYER